MKPTSITVRPCVLSSQGRHLKALFFCQVAWDEPDLLQNVKRVSPWLVELVSSTPAIHHLTPFSPPSRKKLCIPLYPEGHQLPAPMFHGSPLVSRGVGPMRYFPDGGTPPAGVQGARHAQFGISLPDLHHLTRLQSSLSPHAHGLRHQLDHGARPRIAGGLIVGHPAARDDISCLLTIGTAPHKKPSDVKSAAAAPAPQLMLFGKPILTEQQISLGFRPLPAPKKSPSGDVAETEITMSNNSDASSPAGTGSGSTPSISGGAPSSCQDNKAAATATDDDDLLGHCKVFMQSEDVGRTLDLSAVASYEELYQRLADMFGVDKAELTSHVFYRDDASGALKHPGDEPFRSVRAYSVPSRQAVLSLEASY